MQTSAVLTGEQTRGASVAGQKLAPALAVMLLDEPLRPAQLVGLTIAAAGAVEAAVCALAIRDGIAPVSANVQELDPACQVNVVRGEVRRPRDFVLNRRGVDDPPIGPPRLT